MVVVVAVVEVDGACLWMVLVVVLVLVVVEVVFLSF